MTEMTPETPVDPQAAYAELCAQAEDDSMMDSLIKFTANVGKSIDDICSYGLTVGDTYTPFVPDEDEDCGEEDAEMCSQIWVRVVSAAPKAMGGGFGGVTPDPIVMQLELEVGVIRCYHMREDGEAPYASDVLMSATQAALDMKAILRGALKEELWDEIEVGQWVPQGPLGLQYAGIWTFTVTTLDNHIDPDF